MFLFKMIPLNIDDSLMSRNNHVFGVSCLVFDITFGQEN
jgi:hypothetical protein